MQFRPTHALVRSVVAALLLGFLAVFLGRPDVVVLAVPFVAHAGWGLLRRPRHDVVVTSSPRRVVLPEGDAVALHVRHDSPPSRFLTTVQWEQTESAVFDPETGTVMDVPGPDGVVMSFEPERWGRYELSPALVALTDASGSWRGEGAAGAVTATVRPASTTLEGGSGVAHPIGMVGAHRSRHRGDGSDLAEVREFRPGDRLRRINWRVTSRLGAVHVNSMLTERDTEVLIVADTLLDVAAADPDAATSLDATVRAIAAISRHYVGFGDRVAIHDLGHRIGRVRPGTGPRQARIVLNVLSRAHRSGQALSAPRPVPSVASGTLVFFCSPLVERQALDELVRLRRLGAEVIGVDTLPEGVGRMEDIAGFRKETFLGEAWVLRRLQRDDALARVRSLGIPVTAWRGTGSLASLLLSMEAARSAPRRRVGR